MPIFTKPLLISFIDYNTSYDNLHAIVNPLSCFAGEGVSTSLELQYTQELVCRAARALILSGEGTVERKQTAGTLVKQALPSLAYLRKEVIHNLANIWGVCEIEAI